MCVMRNENKLIYINFGLLIAITNTDKIQYNTKHFGPRDAQVIQGPKLLKRFMV